MHSEGIPYKLQIVCRNLRIDLFSNIDSGTHYFVRNHQDYLDYCDIMTGIEDACMTKDDIYMEKII